MIQLTLTLKMTTAQVVETSVTVNNNSPIQDYVHPDDQTQPTFEMTPGFIPFTVLFNKPYTYFWPKIYYIHFHDIQVTCSKHHKRVERMVVRGAWRPSLGLISHFSCSRKLYIQLQRVWIFQTPLAVATMFMHADTF